MADKKTLWNNAGRAGIILGGIPIIYSMCTFLLSKVEGAAVLTGLGNVILWAAKFVLCIWLMNVFMKQWYRSNEGMSRGELFKYGTIVALLSAIVYSAFYLAYLQFIAPDVLDQALETMQDMPQMDSNTSQMMESLLPKLPTITFFFNLGYCWLFGTILSSIFSSRIVSDNPFKEEQ